jgi:rhodanese-related sulfurtransferase/rubrerythrin
MGILDFFKPVDSIAPEEVRKLIGEQKPGDYCLLDVRQEGEYEAGHLPGATLIPLNELRAKHGELDRGKETVVYCRAGVRSRSAAGMLRGLGFEKVKSMSGGIRAYNGIVARGGLDAGMFCFPDTLTPGQMAAVACYLEVGTLAFIEAIEDGPEDTAGILDDVKVHKAEHRQTLRGLYRELSGEEPGGDFPAGVIEVPEERVMVGCVKVDAAVKWARGKGAVDVLELLMALEANALDLYLKLGRAVKSDEAKKAFEMLAEEQQRSIDRVAEVFDLALGRDR